MVATLHLLKQLYSRDILMKSLLSSGQDIHDILVSMYVQRATTLADITVHQSDVPLQTSHELMFKLDTTLE